VSERLVEQARHGDVDAFVALIEKRQVAMTRVAVAIRGERADADDAIQDTLVTLWRELPRLRDVDRFGAWADRILVNSCRLVLRRRRRRVVREIATPTPGRGGADVAHLPTVVASESAAVDRDSFRRAFDALDADARTLIVLHHLEDRSIAEIAAVLVIPEGTVKSRLFAARRALEMALAREERE
jgi:RNA polymerase sigma-70 factor (ECF subfamily)